MYIVIIVIVESDFQAADTISFLALMQPLDVVVKLVDSAVQSQGHVECVAKLLRRLPALSLIAGADGLCALLDRLQQHIVSCSPQMLHCITSFCRMLLVNTNMLVCLSQWLGG